MIIPKGHPCCITLNLSLSYFKGKLKTTERLIQRDDEKLNNLPTSTRSRNMEGYCQYDNYRPDGKEGVGEVRPDETTGARRQLGEPRKYKWGPKNVWFMNCHFKVYGP